LILEESAQCSKATPQTYDTKVEEYTMQINYYNFLKKNHILLD